MASSGCSLQLPDRLWSVFWEGRKMDIARREFLWLSGRAVGLAFATPLASRLGLRSCSRPDGAGGAYGEAGPQITPPPGAVVREFNLTATIEPWDLGTGARYLAWMYNGRVPGPELRVKEGEWIRVVLKNGLPDSTSIHWHGIPVPNPMDGVPSVTQEAVPHGGEFVYRYQAAPAGTFFYDSHAGYQLDQGLYAPLIIEPAHEERSYDREFVLMFEDWVTRDGGGPSATRFRDPMMGGGMMGDGGMAGMMRGMTGNPPPREGKLPLLEPVYDSYAVNGRAPSDPVTLEMREGERVRLRLINAGSSTVFPISLQGHRLRVTHADGSAVQPVEVDQLVIGMGERYDVEFVARNPGVWWLGGEQASSGSGAFGAVIKYRGVNSRAVRPAAPPPGGRTLSYFDLAALEDDGNDIRRRPDRQEQLTLSGGMMGSPFWSIEGQLYPDADPLPVRQGERVRYVFFNMSIMPHPMHLHGHFFRVLAVNGRRLERPPLKDTVMVEHMGEVVVEFLANNPGRWFAHCHNTYHMEAGMARVVEYRR